jgi:hypothetical protein
MLPPPGPPDTPDAKLELGIEGIDERGLPDSRWAHEERYPFGEEVGERGAPFSGMSRGEEDCVPDFSVERYFGFETGDVLDQVDFVQNEDWRDIGELGKCEEAIGRIMPEGGMCRREHDYAPVHICRNDPLAAPSHTCSQKLGSAREDLLDRGTGVSASGRDCGGIGREKNPIPGNDSASRPGNLFQAPSEGGRDLNSILT